MSQPKNYRQNLIIAFQVIVLVLAGAACKRADVGPPPPIAEKIKKEFQELGKTRVDNYYWLKERENPKVVEYLKAENEYLKAIMKPTEALQEKLYQEMVGRIKPTDMSVPYRDNGYYYYTRFEEGKEYPVHCRKKGNQDAPEEVLIDANAMAEEKPFFSVIGLAVSPDNSMLAYAVDTVSRRLYRQHFKDLKSGEVLPDEIPNTLGMVAWANDNRTVFYTLKDTTTLRPCKIMKHRLGAPTSQDQEVYIEDDETFNTAVFKSKSKNLLVIASDSTLSTEYRFLDADEPDGAFRVVQPREPNHEYQVEHFRDKLYIRTNDQAKNFRLMETPLDKPAKENWVEVIPHRDDVLLEDFEIFNDFLVVEERQSGLTRIRAIRWQDKAEHSLDFGEETYAASIGLNPEFDTDWLRYNYSSPTTPNSTYDSNMNTREKKLMKQQEVLGGFRPENYQAERLYATASDGVKVPISLVYRKGMEKNGDNPLLEYGYGSYGANTDPYFNSSILSLLDRGFIYALVNIRGGSEMGRVWYEDGKLLKKKNTFTDFIACAEHLIAEKYTRPEKLFAEGGSAGGLLMGAVVNLRPDLFKGVIAQVPYVDVITTMLDPSIPLTTSEYDEWGNPNIKEYYDYMLSYSPYDNVTPKDYPAMLVTTGLHDSQVQYWEPAKWVAKLRALKTDRNRLLLYTNTDAGHGGASGRFRRYRETALAFAFLLDLCGIKE
ncbi:MAG TPA: S9 family peptidase [Candidatus Desulfaltia sp.]|nr:S9 family peptidase [Candidatus Desulfaltia sp.]